MTAQPLRSRQATTAFIVVAASALGLATLLLLDLREALALVLTVTFVVLAFVAPRAVIPMAILWSVVLSGVRRVMTAVVDSTPSADVLVAVVPITVVVLSLVAARRGALADRSSTTNALLVLLAIAGAGALNPSQGGLLAGFSGLIFFGIPLLWFLVGRSLADERVVRRVLVLTGVASLFVAVYGLAQVDGFFFAHDLRWIDESAFNTITFGGAVRPFATLTSPGEYGRFLAVGLAVIVAWWLERGIFSRRAIVVPAVALLSIAIFLSSVRTAVVVAVIAVAAMFAVRRRARLGVAALLGVAGLAGLVLVVGWIAGPGSGERADTFVERQTAGLSQPFDDSSSNANLRLTFLIDAIADSADAPLGQGTAYTTPASKRFGDDAQTAETDFGDVALSWGIFGLVTYVALVVLAGRQAYELALRRRDWITVAIVGVLAAAFLQWINGGLYAIAPVVWLLLGWVDGELTRTQRWPPPLRSLETSSA